MFISTFEIFKIGIGPSSSHTIGPMVAAFDFQGMVSKHLKENPASIKSIRCTLRGSLAFTGHGHATDRAVVLGLNGYLAEHLTGADVSQIMQTLWHKEALSINEQDITFQPASDVVFDYSEALAQHPNGMIFEAFDAARAVVLTETYFSIGGGFIKTLTEMSHSDEKQVSDRLNDHRYPFKNASEMMSQAKESHLSIADMKFQNEQSQLKIEDINQRLDGIATAMCQCVESGLSVEGILPGKIKIKRRAKSIYQRILGPDFDSNVNDWLSVYAIAVNEENAAGNMVVTAPTNGAAGVVPSVLYYLITHEKINQQQIREYLLTAAAIGAIVKINASISGAEMGCQAEVGSASAMAAAGLCALWGGTVMQIENAAEIALEHHLGMTCDPVEGLVQVPCIERNAFGAIKSYNAARLALHGNGEHFMPLDGCIAAMKQIGDEMSTKFKETSLGGLAVSIIEC